MRANRYRVERKRLMRFSGGIVSCLTSGRFIGLSSGFDAMKTSWTFIASLALTVASVSAQETPLQVTERGPHYRIWQRVKHRVTADGEPMAHTNAYTELATGLHYKRDGQWVDSKEEIEPFEKGAVARQGPYQVIFANTLNTAGSIDVQTPDQTRT